MFILEVMFAALLVGFLLILLAIEVYVLWYFGTELVNKLKSWRNK